VGKKEMTMPTTWQGWAVRVSLFVREGKKLIGQPRFPIRIEEVALHYSRSVFPKDPIIEVEGQNFSGKWEGALVPKEDKSGWGILFDTGHSSRGRINFTLAHEFAHYLAHRHLTNKPFYCRRQDMYEWDSAYAQMEAEANQFAAQVLMPPDDFREQTESFLTPTLAQFAVLQDRYEVSLTAVVLNWLKSTDRRAMVVVSKDGFIDWSWSSTPLFKSGVYFKARQVTTAVPEGSLAGLGPVNGIEELRHPPGVWSEREGVLESVVFADSHDMTISLLIYPKHGPSRWEEPEEESELLDTYEAFKRGER
jgi:hypothetical protein